MSFSFAKNTKKKKNKKNKKRVEFYPQSVLKPIKLTREMAVKY